MALRHKKKVIIYISIYSYHSLNTPSLTLCFHYGMLTLGPTRGMMPLEETYTAKDQRMRPGLLLTTKISHSCKKWLYAMHIHQGFDLESPGCWLSSKGIKLRTPDQSYHPPSKVTSICSTVPVLLHCSWTCLFLMLRRNLGERQPVQDGKDKEQRRNSTGLTRWHTMKASNRKQGKSLQP